MRIWCRKIRTVNVITTTWSMSLLVDCQSPRVSPAQQPVLRYWHENTDFVLLNLLLQNVENYYKARNVPPSCKALIPFTDLAILFGPFGLQIFIFYISFGFQIFWPRASLKRHILSKCASGAGKFVPLMLLLPLGRCLCWWTVSPRGYHQPNSQYFGTGMKIRIFVLYKFAVTICQ